jgi:hypothetical protein
MHKPCKNFIEKCEGTGPREKSWRKLKVNIEIAPENEGRGGLHLSGSDRY